MWASSVVDPRCVACRRLHHWLPLTEGSYSNKDVGQTIPPPSLLPACVTKKKRKRRRCAIMSPLFLEDIGRFYRRYELNKLQVKLNYYAHLLSCDIWLNPWAGFTRRWGRQKKREEEEEEEEEYTAAFIPQIRNVRQETLFSIYCLMEPKENNIKKGKTRPPLSLSPSLMSVCCCFIFFFISSRSIGKRAHLSPCEELIHCASSTKWGFIPTCGSTEFITPHTCTRWQTQERSTHGNLETHAFPY